MHTVEWRSERAFRARARRLLVSGNLHIVAFADRLPVEVEVELFGIRDVGDAPLVDQRCVLLHPLLVLELVAARAVIAVAQRNLDRVGAEADLVFASERSRAGLG